MASASILSERRVPVRTLPTCCCLSKSAAVEDVAEAIIKAFNTLPKFYLSDTEFLFGSMEGRTDTVVDSTVALLEATEAFRIEFVASDGIIIANNEISVPSFDKNSGS